MFNKVFLKFTVTLFHQSISEILCNFVSSMFWLWDLHLWNISGVRELLPLLIWVLIKQFFFWYSYQPPSNEHFYIEKIISLHFAASFVLFYFWSVWKHVWIHDLKTAISGQKISIFNEHKSYVQGVTWDPLGQYIATLSCDRWAVGPSVFPEYPFFLEDEFKGSVPDKHEFLLYLLCSVSRLMWKWNDILVHFFARGK